MLSARRPDQLRSSVHLSVGLLALACGLVPLIAVHLSYIISASQGQVPWCFTYIEGCTSISRAARFGLANYVFKGLMLPCAALIAVFWSVAWLWLIKLAPEKTRRVSALALIGMIGALFLALYATFLGVEGHTYQWLRRYGVSVYFSFTVLAQMMMASVLARGWLRASLLGLCLCMLLLGLISLPLQHFLEDRDAALNAIEWCYALLMTSGFICIGMHWIKAGVAIRMND